MVAEQSSQDVKRTKAPEGPRKQLIAFGISIFLTILAFIAINYADEVSSSFLMIFLVSMAFLQAIIQAIFWMHLKDRGTAQQRVFIGFGATIAIIAVYTAVYWLWW